ncbi:MAG: hypothetical protein H0X41_03825 [Chitinophagaceae bacterium]|nr:hypothetical protein [Chitinophagaceae bacterium]
MKFASLFPVIILLYILPVLFAGCAGAPRLSSHYTFEDKTVFELIDKLNKNANDQQSATLLPEAYKVAADKRKSVNQATLHSGNLGDRYMQINTELQVMQKMYEAIKSSTAASKAVPAPWDPSKALAGTREKAAKEYYSQGLENLNYNNRQYALKAYDFFKKANDVVPGYENVRNLMSEALEKGTLKVVVEPVNYNRFNWSYWGFQNDYLQQQMVSDLNAGSYNNTRFYTDRDASAQRLQADRLVHMNFTDLYVGPVTSNRNTIQRSAQIQTGTTRSIPAKPVYTTVRATVFVSRSIMQSNATLECRIYDYVSGNNILYDRFPDQYTWQQETATFRGDERALTSADRSMINNGSGRPPSRNDIAARLIRNCYGLLLSRIRSGVNFQ